MRDTKSWFVAALLLGLLTCTASAQAWLPTQGTWGFEMVANDSFNRDHYLPDGNVIDVGHTRTQALTLGLSHSLTDRLQLAASIPYVQASYHGDRPHAGTDIDDGRYRGVFTDWRIEGHYQLTDGPIAFAPYLALVIPSHHYRSLGHAAPGRNLHERWIGFFTARSLNQWLPRSYLQARVNFAFVETVANIGHDRANIDFEFGHFLTPALSLSALTSWQETYGGIEVPVPPTHPLYLYHDRLASERYVELGAGANWKFSSRASVYMLYKAAVSGANGHKLNRGVTLGLTYGIAAGN
jgi:hypothetical protein